MGGPRKAIDAAMLTAPIGVHRPVKRNVRRLVEGDDGAGNLIEDLSVQPVCRIFNRIPAIVKGVARFPFIPSGLIRDGATPPMLETLCHARCVEKRDPS